MAPGEGGALDAAGDRVRDAAERGADGLLPWLDAPLVHVSGISVTPGGLLVALAVVVVAWLLSLVSRRALKRYGDRNANANQAAIYTISRLVHYLVLVIGFLVALEVAGIPVGRFAVFAGALGVGLGFGLQAIFSNFVSGLILLFDRSLKVGDFVELDADVRGTVQAINIRATRITTNDDIDVLVPNSEFVSGRVVNWTLRSSLRRIRIRFGVAYGVDKELVKKAALEAASRVPFTLSMDGPKAPQVWLVNFGDNAVEFVLAVWLGETAARRNSAIQAAYLWELDTSLKAHGIGIPFPQRDLHLRSAFGLEGDAALSALRGGDASGSRADVGAGDDRRDAPQLATLDDSERAALSRNDAQVDAQRQLDADEALAAQLESGSDAPGTGGRDPDPGGRA
ncbi:mechanosensitive ion channel family protein [Luteimonas changyuni]|uniref:mechanosensitive ion channel family protein n=1 Tax=Luteimonas sp. MJ145 TaxID=3129234 RepID=UPI0031B9BA28